MGVATRAIVGVGAVALLGLGIGSVFYFQKHNQSLDQMNKGVELARQKLYDSAVRELRGATTIDPKNDAAWYNLGKIHQEQKNWEDAIKAFNQAVEISGDKPAYHYELGFSYQSVENLPAARVAYESCVKLDSRLYKCHFRLGTVLEAEERYKEADTEYRLAIESNQRFVPAYLRLGYLYLDHDYDKEAVQVFQNAVLADEHDGETHLGLGLALQKTKQYDDSIKSLKNALDINQDLYLAIYNIGITYKLMNDKRNARDWLQRFITVGDGRASDDLVKAARDVIYQIDAPP